VDKKPLIGISLCVIILLVLGSLSTVIGYQSVKSTVNDSPLFTTRTKRATNQEQNGITSQYLGMGNENFLRFPMRDTRTDSLIKAIEYIGKMDDETFERFIVIYIQKIRQDEAGIDMNPFDIAQAFRQLRMQPEIVTDTFIHEDHSPLAGSNSVLYPSLCKWFPGCFLTLILISLYYNIICRRTAIVVACQTLFEPCSSL